MLNINYLLDGFVLGLQVLCQSIQQVVTGIIQSGNPLCIALLVLFVLSIFIPIKKIRR